MRITEKYIATYTNYKDVGHTVDLIIFARLYFLRISDGLIREFRDLAKILIMIPLLKKNEK